MNASEGDFIHISIGQRTDGETGDVLVGIGLQLDQGGHETGKILIRAQLGKDRISIEGVFDPTEILVHQDAISEALSLANTHKDLVQKKKTVRRR